MRPHLRRQFLVLVLLSAGACGDNLSAPRDGSIDGHDASLGDGAPAGDANLICRIAIDALKAELFAQIGACTVTLRLDYQTRAPLGHQVVCGAYTAVDKNLAAATSTADTGYGTGDDMLNEPAPETNYVFYRSPADLGGAGAVNRDNGLSVFGGSIVWDGAGALTYPSEWRDPVELGVGCLPGAGVPIRGGWDLRDGMALSAADIDAAIDVVLGTAVPLAFWEDGDIFSATVLLYPRTVGSFDPATAEWIVMVNGGWLD